MAVPTPLNPTAGDILSAVSFNAGVKGPLDFLMAPPRVHVFRSTAQTITNAGTSVITYDSEVYDTDTMHSTTSNTSRVVFTTAGLYQVHAHTTMANAVYTQLDQITCLNANAVSSVGVIRTVSFDNSASVLQQCDFHFERFFSAGDYIETFISQTSGASRNTGTTNYGTFLQARWVAIS